MAGVLLIAMGALLKYIRQANGGGDTHPPRHPESDLEIGGESVRGKEIPPAGLVYRFEGPLFSAWPKHRRPPSSAPPPVVIFRMGNVPAIDVTGLRVLHLVRGKLERRGTRMVSAACNRSR
jgi:SulP family sulfate permease